MAHHRCTRCKQESSPRHKWMGGVFCDSCIREIRGYRPHSGRSWLGSLWDRIVDFTALIFRPSLPTHQSKAEAGAVRVQFKTMEARARSIPPNPAGGVPQGH